MNILEINRFSVLFQQPTEIHNGDIGTRLFQGVKDQTIMSNVVAS